MLTKRLPLLLIGCAGLFACGDSASGGAGGGTTSSATSSGGSGGQPGAGGSDGGASTGGTANVGGAGGAGGSGGAGGATCAGPQPTTGGTTPSAGTPGVPQLLASGQAMPGSVIVDDTYVYWVTWEVPGSVRRIPKEGGEVEIITGDTYSPWDLTMDATTLYFGDDDLGVKQISKQGGCVIQIAADQDVAEKVAVDATHVYWVTTFEGAIRRAPIGGGAVEDIATGQDNPKSLGVDATHVYWANNAGNVQEAGTVNRAPKAGGAVELLAQDQTLPWDLELVDDQVYWFNASSADGLAFPAGVHHVPKTGGTPVFVGESFGAYDMSVDTDEVFCAAPVPMKIEGISRADGTVRTLTTGTELPDYVAHDATHVYWSNNESGTIYRILK